MQHAHLGGQGRLITDGRRDAAEQRRDLGAGLGEAEDVVDEEHDVLAFVVAEVLRDGEGRQRDAGAGAGRLVHLAVDQRGLREHRITGRQLRLGHLVVKIAAFAGALADAGEHREATVLLGDVVDQLEDEHGLADAGATEQTDLATAAVGGQQVDDLDAGLEHLDLDRLVDELGRRAVDRMELGRGDRPGLVDGQTDDVEDAAEDLLAHRHHDRRAGVLDHHAADQTVGGVHRDAADRALAQVLGDLDDDVVGTGVDRGVGDRERGVDLRQVGAGELDVHDGADDLEDASL